MPTQVGYSRLGHIILPISGKPEIGAVLILRDARTSVRVCANLPARALLRMRTAELAARCRIIFGNSHLTMSNSPSRSRGALCVRVLPLRFTHPESRGGRSAEKRSGARRNTREACHLASKTRVSALMTRDARLSALHRGGFGPRGRASVSFGARRPTTAGICLRLRAASSSQPGHSAWRAGSRASRGERLQAAAAGRHTSLRLQDVSGDAPR